MCNQSMFLSQNVAYIESVHVLGHSLNGVDTEHVLTYSPNTYYLSNFKLALEPRPYSAVISN